jgi:hypothetical protein
MRKTTICRSDVARTVALIAVLAGVGCLAGRLDAQQPAPTAAQAAQGQPMAAPPATHTVQKGETLWGLARQFLGDPLLWAEIYRLNTDVVEDPHWIFPGEELRFAAPEPVAAVPAAAAPAPSVENIAVTPDPDSARGVRRAPAPAPVADSPTIFASRPAPSQDLATIEMRDERAYRAVRVGEYYASGFITDRRALPTGTLVGPVERAAIRRLTTRNSAALYSTVWVTAPAGGVYARGDLLLIYAVDQVLPGYGDLIKPLGLLQVLTEASGGRSGTARVTALYTSVSDGDLLTRVAPFRFDNSARAQPVDSGVVGRVIATRSGRELTSTQDVLYIDRGADDGLRLGDVFRINSAPGADPVRVQAEALVVHTDPKTATLLVIQVTQPDIRAGATARQIRRMPS